jgi:fibronectin-binding autotransporter adhesin
MRVGWRQVRDVRARHSLVARALVPIAALYLGAGVARAQDATWVGGGATPNLWGEDDNWNPATVPTGNANFTNNAAPTAVQVFFETTNAVNFDSTSPSYTFTLNDFFVLNGAGITNNSTNLQTFDNTQQNINFLNSASASAGSGPVTLINESSAVQIIFANTSSLGTATLNNSADIEFNNNASAGTGTIDNLAAINFNDSTTAGSANITNNANASISFNSNATAGSAIFSSLGNGTITFNNSSSAGTATFNSNPATFPTYTFNDTSTAGTAHFALVDATLIFNNSSDAGSAIVTMPNVQHPSNITFNDTSTAGNANITNVAITILGTSVQFLGASTAGNATITNNPNSSAPTAGGTLVFGTLGGTDTSNAGTAHIINNQFGTTSFLATTSAAGATIVNNNGGNTNFQDQSTAAGSTLINTNGGSLNFGVPIVGTDTATAGNASITNNLGGSVNFNAFTTAGNANITSDGVLLFQDNSTAGSSRISNNGTVTFANSSTAGNAIITSNTGLGGSLTFTDTSSAANAHIAVGGPAGLAGFEQGATAANAVITNSNLVIFTGNTTLGIQATAANASITNNAGGNLSFGSFDLTFPGGIPTFNPFIGVGTAGNATIVNNNSGTTQFFNQSTAGTATITNNLGGSLQFLNSGGNPTDPDASTARVINNIAGKIDISGVSTGVSIGSVEGAGNIFLGSKSLTLGNTNLSTTISGVIADGGNLGGTGGSLAKIGTGTLTLNGVNTYTGLTTVSGGVLVVGDVNNPGASIGGNATVGPGGALAGHGTILGSIVNNGFLAPGGSIGTLSVGGGYIQSAAGTLSIEVSPTVASQLKVGGAATLAGTLRLVFDPGVYTATSYKIVTASSVGGTFTTVTGTNPTGLPQAILYNPADVTLQLSALPAIPAPVVIVVAPTNDTIYTDLTSTLVTNAQQANGIILDRLGNRPSGVADGEVALGGVAPGLQYAQTGNAAAIGDLASALPQALASQGAWFRGIGGFASVNGNAAAPGFTGTAGGFLAGFDRPISETIYLGVAGGYLHSIVTEHSTGSSGTADTARLALYGGAFLGPSLLTATAGYAHDWIDTSRGLALGTAVEGHSANEATFAGQWSLPLTIQGFGQGAATLTPKAGFQFLHLGERGFGETGAGGFDLAAAGHGTTGFQPFVELALSQKFVTADGTSITPEARLGYDREALAAARTLTVATVSGAQFPVTGVKPAKNMATAGIGLTVQAGPALSLYATYDAVLPTGNTTDQTVQAGLRLRF